MSKIEELINKLCPNGVKYTSLGNICEIKTGKGLTKNDTKEDGIYPIISGGVLPLGYYEKYNRDAGNVTIARAGNAGYVNYIETPFWCNDKCFSVIPFQNNNIDKKYMYYFLKNIEEDIISLKSTGTVPTVNTEKVSKIKIPVPPLEVQCEIVHILDDFTLLSAELSAELKERQMQYEYYKDSLFFELNDVKKYKLNEIAQIYDGTHQTPKYKDSGVSFISVENISDIYNSKKFISVEDYNKYKIKPKINDIFMTRIGSIGKCSVYDKEKDLAYYVSLALIRPNNEIVNSYYLKFLIESIIGIKELRKRTLVNAVPIKVNKDDIGKIELPIPNLKEQERIVNILSSFDKLCNDISEGLPAEIEARQKQYEYYRDKLLTFKELKNEG